MSKFKVGDKVRVVATADYASPIIFSGTVTEVLTPEDMFPYTVLNADGESCPCYEQELTLIRAAEKAN